MLHHVSLAGTGIISLRDGPCPSIHIPDGPRHACFVRDFAPGLGEGPMLVGLPGMFRNDHRADALLAGFDRYSGSAIVTGWRNKEVIANYNLTCKRAEPLF
jgi:hypothetical protein